MTVRARAHTRDAGQCASTSTSRPGRCSILPNPLSFRAIREYPWTLGGSSRIRGLQIAFTLSTSTVDSPLQARCGGAASARTRASCTRTPLDIAARMMTRLAAGRCTAAEHCTARPAPNTGPEPGPRATSEMPAPHPRTSTSETQLPPMYHAANLAARALQSTRRAAGKQRPTSAACSSLEGAISYHGGGTAWGAPCHCALHLSCSNVWSGIVELCCEIRPFSMARDTADFHSPLFVPSGWISIRIGSTAEMTQIHKS
ncbi:hypothetical protein NA57DRAFT_54417 [Rhizodiscina lignyota]|uniref:Uncharacterized protein n=1 Tax=Rhizodiscina lignyota TaxID=1504668 RepID=A0A9P4IEY1_9PEZI|nr:hypothetical protein NA57DRAFT_54417 [Rhizodiscina lignyota]